MSATFPSNTDRRPSYSAINPPQRLQTTTAPVPYTFQSRTPSLLDSNPAQVFQPDNSQASIRVTEAAQYQAANYTIHHYQDAATRSTTPQYRPVQPSPQQQQQQAQSQPGGRSQNLPNLNGPQTRQQVQQSKQQQHLNTAPQFQTIQNGSQPRQAAQQQQQAQQQHSHPSPMNGVPFSSPQTQPQQLHTGLGQMQPSPNTPSMQPNMAARYPPVQNGTPPQAQQQQARPIQQPQMPQHMDVQQPISVQSASPQQAALQHDSPGQGSQPPPSAESASPEVQMTPGPPGGLKEPPTSGPLSLPREGNYSTFDVLFKAAQSHALANGYAFVIGRSKRKKNGLKKVLLACDRGGQFQERVNPDQRKRKTTSRKCGCEFGIYAIEERTEWLLRYRIEGSHAYHNHAPSESPSEHPAARKLDNTTVAAVAALKNSGVSARDTLQILQTQSPHTLLKARDVYNARAALRRNPSVVDPSIQVDVPTIYKRPTLSTEERVVTECRMEVEKAKKELAEAREAWQKEVETLKQQLRERDQQIEKFEMFIDICNQRVMVQRERLSDNSGAQGDGSGGLP